ncbi:MAG: NAD(P)H-hydrate dehydratase [Candidatus Aenigmarchaeota archaeon]|nr:NAD(P)H-hydrate dehydratase [Candidatus Aenigmarchaeota archaeon]
MQIKSVLKEAYKKRQPWSRKGNFGKLLVVGGSKTYTGAPSIVGLAAMKSGCDLVYIEAPQRAADVSASFSPNLITCPLKGDFLTNKHFKEIQKISSDAVVFGNGLGEKSGGLCKLMWKIKKPCVIDGDALKCLPPKLGKNFVLTPHAGEFSIITGRKTPVNLESRKTLVKEYAKRLNCTILLKGHVDIISDGSDVSLNKTGNPYMTKGGTGDVLAGICGAILARGIQPYKAACAAAYISGAAGDLAVKKYGESLLATDVIEEIKNVINR